MPLFNGPSTMQAVIEAMFSGSLPSTEATGGSPGSTSKIPRADHRHPRLTSVGSYTLQGNPAVATVMFTRTYTVEPGVVCTLIEAATQQPVTFMVDQWLNPQGTARQSGEEYGGCVVKGLRSQTIPQNLATLLLSAVFNIFGGSAAGAKFSCIAVASSQP